MTKKELQKMISESVRNTIIKEIKPLIKRTIREEFYKIIEEAGSQEEKEDDLSMVNLLEQNVEEDETRQQVQEKIFKSGGRFDNILNQTANQYSGRSISKDTGLNEQKEFVLNTDSINMNQEIDRGDLAAKMGYGDGFKKVGGTVKAPGTENKKPSPLSQIVNKTQRKPDQPVKVSLPTKNADGRPINFDKVPVDIVQNMMKDYSGILKKMEGKSSFVRGGGSVSSAKGGKASLGAFKHTTSQFEFEEDKK